MRSLISPRLLLLLLLAQLANVSAGATIKTSSITMAGPELAVVANQYSNSVTLIRVGDVVEPLAEILVGVSPQTVTYDSDRRVVWVTNQGENKVSVLSVPDAASGEAPQLLGAIDTREAPYGVLIGSKFAYVSAQQADRVQVFDKYNYTLLAEVALKGSPRGMTLSDDARWLYVSHFDSGIISKIETSTFTVVAEISLGSRAGLVQSITLDSAAQFAYVPNTIRNTDNTSLEFDTSVFPFVSIIDLQNGVHLRRQRLALDIIDKPVGLPLESLLSGEDLYVVNAASNDLSVINVANSQLRAHIEVGGFPVGIAQSLDGGSIYIDNAVDGSVSVIDATSLSEISRTVVTQLPFDDNVKQGLKLFHSSDDTRMAKDQWISCATCHFDGGSDNQTWHFPDGLRNTPSLITTSLTAPFHWSGNLDEVQDVENTIRELQGGTGLAGGEDNCTPTCDGAEKNAGRSEALDNLTAFIATLRFGAEVRVASDAPSPEQRGAALFTSTELNCTQCHQAPLFTDNQNHSVNLIEGVTQSINTPTLLNLQLSAPYYHDGRYSTLAEVLQRHPADIAGQTMPDLEAGQLADLVMYLKSLDKPDNLRALPLLSGIEQPSRANPPIAAAVVSIEVSFEAWTESESQKEEEVASTHPGGDLNVVFTHASNVSFDTFLVIQQPAIGAYWYFDTAWKISSLEIGAPFAPLSEHTEPNSLHAHALDPLRIDARLLSNEVFVLHAIVVEKGTSPYEIDNWLGYDAQQFEL